MLHAPVRRNRPMAAVADSPETSLTLSRSPGAQQGRDVRSHRSDGSPPPVLCSFRRVNPPRASASVLNAWNVHGDHDPEATLI